MNENQISSFPMPIRGYLLMVVQLERAMHTASQQCIAAATIMHGADVISGPQLKQISDFIKGETVVE